MQQIWAGAFLTSSQVTPMCLSCTATTLWMAKAIHLIWVAGPRTAFWDPPRSLVSGGRRDTGVPSSNLWSCWPTCQADGGAGLRDEPPLGLGSTTLTQSRLRAGRVRTPQGSFYFNRRGKAGPWAKRRWCHVSRARALEPMNVI